MASTTVTHQGVFDLEQVLDTIQSWMKGHLYGYFEEKQSYSGGRRSLKAKGDRKVDEYAKLALEVSVNANDLKSVEVIKDQQKVQRMQGLITIKVKGDLSLDYGDKFKEGVWASIKTWAHKTFMAHRVGEYEGMIDSDVVELTRAVREALEMSV